ncbi:TonB-dependent receptor [Altererythrobacter sp. KTW20L]|uniref:TonB-dependent receptor n=1 Tax=Altererythrobacter sp. KTW20L TaxID=2942210 RepID=UPI0020C0896A|nr:TonB-dependent receptor [Altererythrobacter sp. KTW20L]MCL6250418.1 TonB-dependent receptor [Altererythrobacter sp. KTW20L]
MSAFSRNLLRPLLLSATALALVVPVAAQAQNTVTGRVVDAAGVGLPGAVVVLRESGQRIVTDRQGRFVVPSIEAGELVIDVIYQGLESVSQTVTVSSGSANDFAITMDATYSTDVITVYGTILDSTARALNQQRNADATTNVVSSDSIGRFPDSNIAEALQRVPGFGVERDQGEGNFISIRGAPSEFTSITVDGINLPSTSADTRAVDLGSIPSDVVSSLEVSKTLLPSQSADSIAGSVNLTTRSPFDDPRLRISANGGVSHNQFGNTNDYRFGGTVSTVSGPVGLLLSGSLAQTDRKVDNFESVWEVVERPEGNEILGVPEQEFKDYDTRRERLALTGAIELEPDNVSRYFVRGTWSKRTDDEFRNLLAVVYADGDLQPGATETVATWNDTRVAREFRHRVKVDESFVVSAGGVHDFSTLSLDYTASYSRAEETYPIRAQLLFRSSLRPDITQDFTTPDAPTISLFETGEHLDFSRYSFREITFREQDTMQDEWAFQANVSVAGELFGAPATFQTGARVRLAEIGTDNEQWRNRGGAAAPTQSFANLMSDIPSQNFAYLLGNKYDSDLVRAYFEDVRPIAQTDATRRISNSIVSDYEASEDIYAGYAMTRVEFDRANLVLGLRVEHTSFSGSAPVFNTETETFTVGQVDRSYTDFFPNLTLRYELADDLVARFALTRAVSRPNFRDVVPRVEENSDSTTTVVDVSRGNPDLKQTLSNNLDFGLEYYFPPLGLLSANFFYKDLEDYEFTLTTPGTFNGLPARISEKLNATSGHIMGFELAAQAQFTFLPGALSGFGVFGNLSYADAEITLPGTIAGRASKVALPNQSEWTYNAAIFYEMGGFNARLAYTRRTDYVDEFNEDARLDTFWEGREQVDLTASYDVTDNVNIFFEGKNLTNTPGVRYAGNRARVTEYEKFGRLYFIGARVNF